MEPLKNSDQAQVNRPSARFIAIALIAIAAVLLFLYAQRNDAIRSFFGKNKQASTEKDHAVLPGAFKDSNNNGIPDWEEKLWGLDPAVLTTNGVPNKDIIAAKKQALEQQNNGGKINKTDQLAQNIFLINSSTAGDENGQSAQEASIADSALEKLSKTITPNQYRAVFTKKDIKTIPTTTKSVAAYQQKIIDLTATMANNDNEIDIIIQATEGGDTTTAGKLPAIGKTYITLAQKIAKVPVPVGAARYHLAMINNLNGIGKSLIDTTTIADDPVAAVSSITAYRNYSNALTNNSNALQDYLVRYTSN